LALGAFKFNGLINLLIDLVAMVPKNHLGLGRLVNNVALFIAAYYLLTRYWGWFYLVLGWLLAPLG
jgi:hypothetical protein